MITFKRQVFIKKIDLDNSNNVGGQNSGLDFSGVNDYGSYNAMEEDEAAKRVR